MPGSRKIGDAFIRVRADTTGFAPTLKRDAEKAGREAGEAGGRLFGRDFTNRVGDTTTSAFRRVGEAAVTALQPTLRKLAEVGEAVDDIDRHRLGNLRGEVDDLNEDVDAAARKADGLGAELGAVDRSGLNRVRGQVDDLGDELGDAIRAAERLDDRLDGIDRRTFSRVGEQIRDITQRAGGLLSGVFSSGIASTVTLIVGAAAAVVAGGIAAATGALLAAGGAGLVGGLVGAAKDPRVAGAFTGLAARIGAGLAAAAQPFVLPLVGAAQRFGTLWTSTVEPSMRRIFAALAPLLTPLAEGLASFVEKALPGVEKLVLASAPLFKTLAEHLPTLGEAVGKMADTLSDPAVVDAANRFLDIMLTLTEKVLPFLARIIGVLALQFRDWVRAAILVRDGVVNAWNGIVDFVRGLGARISAASAGMWHGVWLSFRSTINQVIGGWNRLKFKVPSVSFLGQTIGGFTLGVADIPRLDVGGSVEKTGVAVVHRGEVVTPAGRRDAPVRLDPRDLKALADMIIARPVQLLLDGRQIFATVDRLTIANARR